MALRGLSFAVALRRTVCQPSVRFIRTKREIDSENLDSDAEFEGAYASNEVVEKNLFATIRRDRQNIPHRHGEYEASRQVQPLLGFDIPLPEKVLQESKQDEGDDEPRPESKEKAKGKKNRPPNAEKPSIQIRTVMKEEPTEEFSDELNEEPKTAFDAVKAELKKRDEPKISDKKDSFGFRVLISEVKPQIWTMPKPEVFKCLMRNIIFDSSELLVLDKPYGLSMHGGGGTNSEDSMALTAHLDDMAKAYKVEKLYPVHRLDKSVTGVLCIAKNQEIANIIKAMFKARQVHKEYVAITKGVPPQREGIIEKAIAVGTFDKRERMVIVPTAEPGAKTSVPKFKRTFPAVTRYKVIDSQPWAAFVRLLPETGYKHQLRVHLGFGLHCPILGDHKYNNVRKISPQKLPGAILDRLKVRQQKVRDIPLHLHSRHIAIPGILEGNRNLVVRSPIPTHFKNNLRRLKLEY